MRSHHEKEFDFFKDKSKKINNSYIINFFNMNSSIFKGFIIGLFSLFVCGLLFPIHDSDKNSSFATIKSEQIKTSSQAITLNTFLSDQQKTQDLILKNTILVNEKFQLIDHEKNSKKNYSITLQSGYPAPLELLQINLKNDNIQYMIKTDVFYDYKNEKQISLMKIKQKVIFTVSKTKDQTFKIQSVELSIND